MLRQIKAMDFSLVAEQRQKSLYDERASYTTKDEKGNPILAEHMDIGLIMLYGHVMYAGNGHIEALSKKILIPHDPCAYRLRIEDTYT